MSSEDLKPCPFCGGNTEIYWSRKNKYWQVSCEGTDIADGDQGCGMEGPETHAFPNSSTPPDKSKDEALREAIEEWNNYSSPQLDEAVSALKFFADEERYWYDQTCCYVGDREEGVLSKSARKIAQETLSNLRGDE